MESYLSGYCRTIDASRMFTRGGRRGRLRLRSAATTGRLSDHRHDRPRGRVRRPGRLRHAGGIFEVLTLKQLGRHNPAIAVLNTGGFCDSLQKASSAPRWSGASSARPACRFTRAAADAGENAAYL